MNTLSIALILFGGFVVGFVIAWLTARSRITALSTELKMTRVGSEDNLKVLEAARESMSNAFKALSSDALRESSTQFLELAKLELGKLQSEARGDLEKRQTAVAVLVTPLRESLEKVEANIRQLEVVREGAYRDLLSHVRQLADTQRTLELETVKLVNALRTPRVGGLWGEIQLRRIVELSGMKDNYDFIEQKAVSADERRYIPDLVVKLPGEKSIVVDAKVSTKAYLEAVEAGSEAVKEASLKAFAGHVKAHVDTLKSKKYWEHVPGSTEFVVMFLPGENFLQAALDQDPNLIEYGATSNVILATPTTLISLFKAVAYRWRQEVIARNAVLIRDAGEKLYRRLGTFVGHFEGIKKGIDRA
ncbi:MAG: DNA recombination protein RmuC, partial [bacterium]